MGIKYYTYFNSADQRQWVERRVARVATRVERTGATGARGPRGDWRSRAGARDVLWRHGNSADGSWPEKWTLHKGHVGLRSDSRRSLFLIIILHYNELYIVSNHFGYTTRAYAPDVGRLLGGLSFPLSICKGHCQTYIFDNWLTPSLPHSLLSSLSSFNRHRAHTRMYIHVYA